MLLFGWRRAFCRRRRNTSYHARDVDGACYMCAVRGALGSRSSKCTESQMDYMYTVRLL